MMIQTTVGVPMDAMVLNNYFRTLINLFFKILPIKESGESSLDTYMRSLQAELLGCKELIEAIHEGRLDERLTEIYADPYIIPYEKKRYEQALYQYNATFGADEVEIFSAPGRSEIGGNHTEEDIDGVIHFAASSQVGESMKDPLKYYSNNLCGTEVLLESMVAHGIDKIVFSSTAATYGEPESIPILETDPTVPTNCYGETKLSMEKTFHWTSIAHNLRYVSLRYFNACGAHPNGKIGEAHNPETHLIPLILQVPNHQREYISIFGTDYDTKDGTCVRDYIHVNDLAQAHILAMNYLRNGGKSDIFNLGNGVGFTVKEVVETAREVTGHPIPAKEEARRAGDPSTLIASSGRAKGILGWKPQYADLRVIIETAWKWHQAHPHGYKAD